MGLKPIMVLDCETNNERIIDLDSERVSMNLFSSTIENESHSPAGRISAGYLTSI